MCNRFRMTARQAELAAAYGITAPYPEDVTYPPPELFPKRPAWVVREHEGARALDVMSWGFPHVVTGKTGKPTEQAIDLAAPYPSQLMVMDDHDQARADDHAGIKISA